MRLYFRRCWGYLTTTRRAQPLPDFDFVPVEAFDVFMGLPIRYEIVNPVDLIMQQRDLMPELLTLDVHMTWSIVPVCMKYSASELRTRGSASCVLYYGEDGLKIYGLENGVCGHLRDRKRISKVT